MFLIISNIIDNAYLYYNHYNIITFELMLLYKWLGCFHLQTMIVTFLHNTQVSMSIECCIQVKCALE